MLEPEPDAGHRGDRASFATAGTGEACSISKPARPRQAHAWRELAPHFIAQPQAIFEVGQAGAGRMLWVAFAVKVCAQLRLEDQALREQDFIAYVEAGRDCASGTLVSGGLGLEPIRRQPLHAKRQPVSGIARTCVVPYADLRTPERRNGVIP